MKPELMKWDFQQKQDAPEVLELYLYSEVAPDGYDWWDGEKIESETSQNYFRDRLAEYPDVKEIVLYINSCGGSVREGYGIYAQLKRHPAKKTVYVDGFANSIASIIAMAGDHIVMCVNSMMGVHNVMDYCFGNSADHRKCAGDLDRIMEGNRQIYLSRSGGRITPEQLTALLDAETMLTAEECLGYGFCDEITGTASEPGKAAEMVQRMNRSLAAQARYFTALRQSLRAAVDAAKGTPEGTPPPAKPPQPENQPMQFLMAMNAGK